MLSCRDSIRSRHGIMRNGYATTWSRRNRILDMRSRYEQSIAVTTDERLDRLTEPHEAMMQSVEMLIKDVREMVSLVNEIALGTARLLHVAENHEQRISRLEGD